MSSQTTCEDVTTDTKYDAEGLAMGDDLQNMNVCKLEKSDILWWKPFYFAGPAQSTEQGYTSKTLHPAIHPRLWYNSQWQPWKCGLLALEITRHESHREVVGYHQGWLPPEAYLWYVYSVQLFTLYFITLWIFTYLVTWLFGYTH